ncbi:gluconokinase [Yeosuana sp. MJ-SS3]|uniref:Gluconokinase n=1 Tax=Gilvirhabdus luticola TaxID=3079858 RepID=A0ABU3U9H6_9FLAO|nr:gluconokinase [Yeosuana sp. MJ-SS3]MDU8887063.1 gluconokinase [Yeosuana sp. MJ-SS3]
MIIIMGVSGCGKTTIGKLLSKETQLPFFDADDFHPEENIKKMKTNESLTDEDRLPWLNNLASKIEEWENNGGAILACSALKESYRKLLSSKTENIFWVFLDGSFDLIKSRLEQRHNHYMKSDLLQSQFNTLEEPNYGLKINIAKSKEDIIKQILLNLND